MSFFVVYLILGLFSGFIAGLLGVGGGLVLVPALSFAFAYQDFSAQYNMHMALGTSLAVIVLTSLSSLRAHHKYGAVQWQIVSRMSPGIVVGALAGSLVAIWLPDHGLKWFFTLFLFYAASQILFGIQSKSVRQLPGKLGMAAAGGIIGILSSWVGIGGGTLSVPFLNACNVRFQVAIGTSAAIGLPIAASGALGYSLSGQSVIGALPSHSLGFIYLPGLILIALTSMLSAPWGARLTHTLPIKRLKRMFAVLLYLIAVRMAWGLLA